jgi:hypothetical protein
MELENIILSELSQAQKTNNRMFSLICGLYIKGKYTKVIVLWSHDKAKAHKGSMRIGKKPKKHDSIQCLQCKGTNAQTLKQQRPIGEGDPELEKRSV